VTLVVVNQGEEAFLDLVLGVNYTLRLYTNDPTAGLSAAQVDALDESDFTEATFPGYSAKALTGGSWTTTPGDPTVGTYPQQSFTRSSTGTPELVRGYYLTTTTGGFLRGFEPFDGPVSMEVLNDEIRVSPQLTLGDREDNAVEVGSTKIWPYSTAPSGWSICDGSAVSRTTYPELHALAAADGYPHGSGDGATTFNLPNMRQRFPLGKATAGTGSTLGAAGGTIDHTHGLDTASSHAKIALQTVAGQHIEERRKTVASYSPTHEVATSLTVEAGTGPITIGTELGGTSDTGNPPYTVVNFIIKLG
jgi:microcystin-dependent protein